MAVARSGPEQDAVQQMEIADGRVTLSNDHAATLEQPVAFGSPLLNGTEALLIQVHVRA